MIDKKVSVELQCDDAKALCALLEDLIMYNGKIAFLPEYVGLFARVSNSLKCSKPIKGKPAKRTKSGPACGHEDCGVSSGTMSEELTFGRGNLHSSGYWEIACRPCAEEFEREHPDMAKEFGVWPEAEPK